VTAARNLVPASGRKTRLVRLEVEDAEDGAARVYEVRMDMDTGENERLHVATMHAVGTTPGPRRAARFGQASRRRAADRFDSRGSKVQRRWLSSSAQLMRNSVGHEHVDE
jgi:hypothetical protein